LLLTGSPKEALALSGTALVAHDKVLGRDHSWTKGSAIFKVAFTGTSLPYFNLHSFRKTLA
jgi:hypothetical protein